MQDAVVDMRARLQLVWCQVKSISVPGVLERFVQALHQALGVEGRLTAVRNVGELALVVGEGPEVGVALCVRHLHAIVL